MDKMGQRDRARESGGVRGECSFLITNYYYIISVSQSGLAWMAYLMEVIIGWEEVRVELVMVTGGWGGGEVMREVGMAEREAGVGREETETESREEVLAMTPQTKEK